MSAVLEGLASNPALPGHLLDRLVAVPPLGWTLAARPDLRAHHVRALLALDDASVVAELLSRGRASPADVRSSDPSVLLAVTGHPDCDPSLVRSLAMHPTARLRLPEIAVSLPADVLEFLAADPEVAAEVVRHHALPAPLADSLSRHPSFEVRAAVAASPHAPVSVLTRLGTEDALARRLAGNPATPGAVAAGLFRDHAARYFLASRTDLPVRVYEQLACEIEPGILTELATNPAVPVEVLRRLTGTRALRLALLRNPALPLDLLAEVAGTTRISRFRVPRVASASAAELWALAASGTAQVRKMVASRADLPIELVSSLVADPDFEVAGAVAANPLVTVDQLSALVERHGVQVHPWVARNASCPPELLHRMALSAGTVAETWRAVASHPAAWGETLLPCLGDAQARHLAAGHPHLPVGTIVELLRSEFTAGAAASNPSLPVPVMEELVDSSGA